MSKKKATIRTKAPVVGVQRHCSPSLAEKIAAALLTPNGGSECHRLQIMQRLGPDLSDEKGMGGHCKESIINVVSMILCSHGIHGRIDCKANDKVSNQGSEEKS